MHWSKDTYRLWEALLHLYTFLSTTKVSTMSIWPPKHTWRSFLYRWPQYGRAFTEEHSCSSWRVEANSVHQPVQSLDHLVLCSTVLLGSLLRQEPRQESLSCSCHLAFLQPVLFDALHKDMEEKLGSFIKGSLHCYIYLGREKKILKTQSCRNG